MVSGFLFFFFERECGLGEAEHKHVGVQYRCLLFVNDEINVQQKITNLKLNLSTRACFSIRDLELWHQLFSRFGLQELTPSPEGTVFA